MKQYSYVLENSEGKAVRYINWSSKSLVAIYLRDTRRVVFVNNVAELERNKVNFDVVKEISQDQVLRAPVSIGKFGAIKAVENVTEVQKDLPLRKEDEEKLPLFMRYSAASHVGALALVLLTSFVIQKFFTPKFEMVEVKVFEQQRPVETPVAQVVKSSRKKIQQKRVRAAKLSNRTHIAKNNSYKKSKKVAKKVVTRPGQNISNMGALGVLGGMSKTSKGSGGLNLNAKTNNPGIGYGGPAARGGFERGLVGKGLVATGIGQGGSMAGYGGYGTHGKGGGKPGYGSQKMAGSSGGYFEPLRDESLVEGGLDEDQIAAVIDRNRGQITYCYEQGLQVQPSLSGRVNVKFVINGSGAVSVASVGQSSLASKKVEGCILAKLRGWRFPRPVGSVNVRVSYPFSLKRTAQG